MGRWKKGAKTRVKELSGVYTDEQAVKIPSIFLPWEPDEDYEAGDRVRHNDMLFRCLLAHTSQDGWAPGLAPSLWVRMDDPTVEWPNWVQPLGGHDAYALGAKVAHKTKRWVSTTGGNIWEPGVYGWSEVK